MRSKMASGSGNLRRALAMNERDGQIAESSQDLRCMTRAQSRTILAKGHIAHIMGGVLNSPVPAYQCKQALRTGLPRSQRSNKIDHFVAGCSRFADRDGSCEFGHLLQKWPVNEVGIHFGTYPNSTLFDPPSMQIKGASMLKRGAGVSERGGEIGVERRLIVFDGEHGFSSQCIHTAQKILLRMQ